MLSTTCQCNGQGSGLRKNSLGNVQSSFSRYFSALHACVMHCATRIIGNHFLEDSCGHSGVADTPCCENLGCAVDYVTIGAACTIGMTIGRAKDCEGKSAGRAPAQNTGYMVDQHSADPASTDCSPRLPYE